MLSTYKKLQDQSDVILKNKSSSSLVLMQNFLKELVNSNLSFEEQFDILKKQNSKCRTVAMYLALDASTCKPLFIYLSLLGVNLGADEIFSFLKIQDSEGLNLGMYLIYKSLF